MSEYSEVKIDLLVLDREVDLVAERFDIALRIGQGSLKDSNLIGKKLFDVDMGLYAAPTFLQEQGEPKIEKDLQHYPLILFSKQIDSTFDPSAGLIPNNFQMKSKLKINDMLTCKEAAIAGLGIAHLPCVIVNSDVKSNNLKQVLSHISLSSVALFAVYLSRQWMPSKLKVFLEYLKKWDVAY